MISGPATRSKSSAPKGQPVMVPFTRAVVPVVDLDAGRLVIDPPPGLLEPSREDPLPGEEAIASGSRRRTVGRRKTRMTWRATVLTIFPEMLPGPLAYSLAGKALDGGHLAAGNGGHPRFRAR